MNKIAFIENEKNITCPRLSPFLEQKAETMCSFESESEAAPLTVFPSMEITLLEGSGVGMAIVKRMVDKACGRIELESEAEKGTVFKVFLRCSI